MKIGVLGGTFDPVHNGHISLAAAAKRQFELDQILFIPANIPPHKKDRERITPAFLRVRMVEEAIKGIQGFKICSIEIERGGVSYTADTLKQLKEMYPRDQLFLILGEDCLLGFESWKESGLIKKLASIAVARRPEAERNRDSSFLWIDMPEFAISSSQIRQAVKDGNMPSGLLPDSVAALIVEHKLYRS